MLTTLGSKISHRAWHNYLQTYVLAVLGPLLYLSLTIFSWLGSWHETQTSYVSSAGFALEIQRHKQTPLQLQPGLRRILLYYGNFALAFSAERPLQISDHLGRRIGLKPISYDVLPNGVDLHFEQGITLRYERRNTAEHGGNGFLLSLQPVEGLPLPQFVELPWALEHAEKNQALAGGGLAVQEGSEESYYYSYTAVELLPSDYLKIPVQDYHFIAQQDTKPILWSSKRIESAEGSSWAENSFRILYGQYIQVLYQNAQQIAEKGDIPSPEWGMMYLRLALQYGDYQKARNLLISANWEDPLLYPFIGTNTAAINEDIRMDRQRIRQIETTYLYEEWSFIAEENLGSLLLNYGNTNLTLGLLQRAWSMQDSGVNDKEKFYSLKFLWNTIKLYPGNGIYSQADIKPRLDALLRSLAQEWRQNLAGADFRFVLDVVKTLWDEEFGLTDEAYQIGLLLLPYVEADGSLRESGSSSVSGSIPADIVEGALCPPDFFSHSLRSQVLSIIPGFWLRTAGHSEVLYRPGRPIEVDTPNLTGLDTNNRGSKLLLFYGIYFFPIDVTQDGRLLPMLSDIPSVTDQATGGWFYNPNNRVLAVETFQQDKAETKIIIR